MLWWFNKFVFNIWRKSNISIRMWDMASETRRVLNFKFQQKKFIVSDHLNMFINLPWTIEENFVLYQKQSHLKPCTKWWLKSMPWFHNFFLNFWIEITLNFFSMQWNFFKSNFYSILNTYRGQNINYIFYQYLKNRVSFNFMCCG